MNLATYKMKLITDNPDGFHQTHIEVFGGAWQVEVGYKIESLGTPSRTWMGREGLEMDEGEAPTVRIVSLSIIGDKASLALPLWLLTGEMTRNSSMTSQPN